MKKRILHIVDHIGLGGSGTMLKGLFEAQKDNKNIFLYALRSSNTQTQIDHQNIFSFSSHSKFSLRPLFQLKKFIREKNITVLHCHLRKAQFTGWVLKRFFFPDMKLIFHEHGAIFRKEREFIFFLNIAKRIVDLFVAVSQNTKDRIRDYINCPENKIVVLYNYINLETFQKNLVEEDELQKIRNEYNISDDDFVIGFVGRLNKVKNTKCLVKAVQYLQIEKLKVLIIGDGVCRKELEDLKETVGGSENIIFLGYKPNILPYFSLLDVCVLPSKNEASPMTFYESMALGIPMIGSNVYAINEFIEPGKNGLLFPFDDEKALASKIMELYSNSSLRDEMELYAKKIIHNYSLDKFLNSLGDIYESVVKKETFCFISSYIFPLFSSIQNNVVHGGAELQLSFLAREFQKDGYRVSVITGDFGQSEIVDIDGISFFKSFVPYGIKNAGMIQKLFDAFKIRKLCKKINADVYFTTSANAIVGVVSSYCRNNDKIHVHRTAHEMDVNGQWVGKNGVLGKVYEKGIQKCEILLTQNESHQLLIHDKYRRDAVIFKNGFPMPDTSIQQKKTQILWVARCVEWKQPEIYLKLAKSFPEEKFIMIAPKTKKDDTYWEKISLQASKMDNLTFIEQVDFSVIQAYFDEAKIFVNTSTAEGFPNTFIQSGLGHTPIVSLSVDPDNFITSHNCGLVCNGNQDQLLKNITKLLSNLELRNQLGENAFQYIENNHSIKVSKDILLQEMDKLGKGSVK